LIRLIGNKGGDWAIRWAEDEDQKGGLSAQRLEIAADLVECVVKKKFTFIPKGG
jgi:hypothetical protein